MVDVFLALGLKSGGWGSALGASSLTLPISVARAQLLASVRARSGGTHLHLKQHFWQKNMHASRSSVFEHLIICPCARALCQLPYTYTLLILIPPISFHYIRQYIYTHMLASASNIWANTCLRKPGMFMLVLHIGIHWANDQTGIKMKKKRE